MTSGSEICEVNLLIFNLLNAFNAVVVLIQFPHTEVRFPEIYSFFQSKSHTNPSAAAAATN